MVHHQHKDPMDKLFTFFKAGWVAVFICNVLVAAAIFFGVVKACDYITSGTAVEHIQEIKK